MLNVTVRGSTVHSVHSNDRITIIQSITWEAPPNHHSIQHYVVKYQMQGQATSSKSMRTSNNVTQATLVLLVLRGKTSAYSVWVAAVSEAGQGEFNDRVDVMYSSKPMSYSSAIQVRLSQWCSWYTRDIRDSPYSALSYLLCVYRTRQANWCQCPSTLLSHAEGDVATTHRYRRSAHYRIQCHIQGHNIHHCEGLCYRTDDTYSASLTGNSIQSSGTCC